jgi:L,D-transpeptidase ErfK/SrfK
VKVFPVAVGKPSSPSPTGTFEIVSRVVDPTWYGPHQVVAPGPSNPLGTRWLGLSEKGYGIHGTNAPGSIGKSASHGCIRMRKHDIEELFNVVRVGDKVELVSEATGDLVRIFEEPALNGGN